MATKALSRVEIKDADKGEVAAVFATLDVVDLDGDVVLPGAFEDGAKVKISAYGHRSWMGALPVGKGLIREVGKEALLEGQFFMDTVAGADTFRVVKALEDEQEWSFGFDAIKYSFGERDGAPVRFLEQLKTWEVSPVLLGAGIDTRTIGAKGAPLKFVDEAEQVVAMLTALVDRAADVMAMRAEKGKALGADSAELLTRVKAQAERLAGVLEAGPTTTDGADADVQAQLALLHARYKSALRRIA